MAIYFFEASVDDWFCVLKDILVNIPKIATFLYLKNSEEYF